MTELPSNLYHYSKDIVEKYPEHTNNSWMLVDTSEQKLYLLRHLSVMKEYVISTSKFGLGSEQDSYKTPLGAHEIAECIGDSCQLNEIFESRKATGVLAEIERQKISTNKDLILTRILWLRGLEKNKNLGDGIDSFQRYIYIHGTHEEGLLGTPASHGCIRMSNQDVVDLYNQVNEKDLVYLK